MPKIAVAMSGGVDSSVAAALMVEKYGKEKVFGITMRLFCYGDSDGSDKSCCSLEAVNDAKKVCDQLGIPHYAISFEKEFEKDVIDDFVSEYEKGHTPNPCIRCNQFIKYEYLLKKAMDLGVDKLVTGHYARITSDSKNKTQKTKHKLLRGVDRAKDQSYFLYNLNQEQLKHVEFPIGELEKIQTRKIASDLNLKTAQKTESQDICFVLTTVEEFLKDRAAYKPGKIVDKKGKVWGEHQGLAFYTIGQRKGLGGGFREIMYVTGLNQEKNEVIIGPEEELFSDTLIVENPHWIIEQPKMPFECTAKIRYQAVESECIIFRHSELDSESIKVTFENPQKAITPGQSIVFYQGDEVIGGGIISCQS